jgi:hypothetical protein
LIFLRVYPGTSACISTLACFISPCLSSICIGVSDGRVYCCSPCYISVCCVLIYIPGSILVAPTPTCCLFTPSPSSCVSPLISRLCPYRPLLLAAAPPPLFPPAMSSSPSLGHVLCQKPARLQHPSARR